MKIKVSMGDKSVEGTIDKDINPILLEEVIKVMCKELLVQFKDTNV